MMIVLENRIPAYQTCVIVGQVQNALEHQTSANQGYADAVIMRDAQKHKFVLLANARVYIDSRNKPAIILFVEK